LINVMRRSEDGECQCSELIRSCAVLLGILRGKFAGVKSQSHQFPVQENARINQRHPNQHPYKIKSSIVFVAISTDTACMPSTAHLELQTEPETVDIISED
jgi:hypothetical protein